MEPLPALLISVPSVITGSLSRAERAAIQSGLDKGRSCRQMARDLGRSPSTVADEVARNRTVSKGPGKGERVRDAPEDACPKLLSWPRCCNGCRNLRYRSCSRRWRCEYSAARAQALADAELRESRIGVDRGEAEFERIMGLIRYDVARGLSPQQIALGRAGQIGASPSTIYRWISRGYAGMCDLDLRRKCGYKPRSRSEPPRPTAHGGARSFAAFMGLPEEGRAAACEMDTVTGLKSDRRCLLTLYSRPFRFQLALLMPGKTAAATESALDMLERAAPKAFRRLFSLLLTDNGAEFADCAGIERSALDPAAGRCSVYYCDVRQSQQKGGCERNHVELRKLLPKGRGISFDRLTGRDCAVLMSQLNSEPRPSLGGMCAIDMLLAALGADGRELLDALGVDGSFCHSIASFRFAGCMRAIISSHRRVARSRMQPSAVWMRQRLSRIVPAIISRCARVWICPSRLCCTLASCRISSLVSYS